VLLLLRPSLNKLVFYASCGSGQGARGCFQRKILNLGLVSSRPFSYNPKPLEGCGTCLCNAEIEPVAKSKKKVETVFLVCEETGDYNYAIRRRTGGEKLKLKKYSPRLRRHTVHVEKKK
jgi:large subunit ribosomal protein L33